MLYASPVAGWGDFWETFGDFLTELPVALVHVVGAPVTIALGIAEAAGLCDECVKWWGDLLDKVGEWIVDVTVRVVVDYVTDPATWTMLATVAYTCLGTVGVGCGPAITVAAANAITSIAMSVAKEIEERAKRVVTERVDRAKRVARDQFMNRPSVPDEAQVIADEGNRIVKSAGEEAGRKARAAAGDLLYQLAPQALLDLFERGGPDADRLVQQSIGPVVELARRLSPLTDPARASAEVEGAAISARSALMSAIRTAIRDKREIDLEARGPLDAVIASVSDALRVEAARGAAAATQQQGQILTGLGLAWSPRDVRNRLVGIYAATQGRPGNPRRVASTAPIWSVGLRADATAPPVSFEAAKLARVNAIAQAPPLASIRAALRARDRIAPDKPYPYADTAIREYIERVAPTVRPPFLDGRANSAAAVADALAPGLAAEFNVRLPPRIGARTPATQQLEVAARQDFTAQLQARAQTAQAAASKPSSLGLVALGVAAAGGLVYVATR